MKILIVSTHPTHPAIEGNRRYILNQVELFKKMGFDIYFLLLCVNKGEWIGDRQQIFQQMNKYWGDKLLIYRKGKFFSFFKKLISKIREICNHGYIKCDDFYPFGIEKFIETIDESLKFDAIIVNYYILSRIFSYSKIPLKGIVTHDYFSYKNILTGVKGAWLCTSADQEAKALQRCPHIFALNSEEAIFFKKLSPRSTIYNVYSTYNIKESNMVGNHKLLFLSGKNNYNLIGLKWFLDKIYPSILNAFPDCSLDIGGGICSVLGTSITNKNINLIGFVDNEETFYDRADVVINPTSQGTGLKIKTFEGLSYGKIVMAHPHSVSGVFEPENCPVFTSIEPCEWVSFLNSIWNNTSLILEIKDKDKEYISKMNRYVVGEYKRFFNSI